jgi:hypothetical protein
MGLAMHLVHVLRLRRVKARIMHKTALRGEGRSDRSSHRDGSCIYRKFGWDRLVVAKEGISYDVPMQFTACRPVE